MSNVQDPEATPKGSIGNLVEEYIVQILGTDSLVSFLSTINVDVYDEIPGFVEKTVSLLGEEAVLQFKESVKQAALILRRFADAAEKAGGNVSIHGSGNKMIVSVAGEEAEALDFDPDQLPFFQQLFEQSSMLVRFGSRADAIRRSLLVNSVSAFEVFFGGLAREILKVNTAALDESGHTFTIKDLLAFETIDDAREVLIDLRVGKLLHEGIDTWDKWFKNASKTTEMHELPLDWSLTREVFARRNIAVHANLTVNHQYLKEVSVLKIAKPVIGDRLPVDDEYLHAALSLLASLGTLLAAAAWMKIYPRERDMSTRWLLRMQKNFLTKNLWRPTFDIWKFCDKLQLPREISLKFYINALVAHKEIVGLEAAREIIENWDTSGLDLGYAHAKTILLEEASALDEVKKLFSERKLNLHELTSNPLYRHFLLGIAGKFDAGSAPE